MKKLLGGALILLLSITLLAGCGGTNPDEKRYALVTGPKGTAENAEVAAVWEGTKAAANIRPCVAMIYRAEEETVSAYKEQFKAAVKDGAKVIVLDGAAMGEAAEAGQKAQKNTKFILVNGWPGTTTGKAASESSESGAAGAESSANSDSASGSTGAGSNSGTADSESSEASSTDGADVASGADSADSSEATVITPEYTESTAASEGESTQIFNKNTCVLTIRAKDAGFLAGYILVSEGYTKLGFMCSSDAAENAAFENGFILGADAAAQEKALGASGVTLRVAAVESGLSPLTMDKALTWYEEGTQVIFTPEGNVLRSVLAAAETKDNAYVAAAGVNDPASQSEKILLSANRDYRTAVLKTIQDFENDSYPGGQAVSYGLTDGCVSIAADYTRFQYFTEASYNLLVSKIGSGAVRIGTGDVRGGTDTVSVVNG